MFKGLLGNLFQSTSTETKPQTGSKPPESTTDGMDAFLAGIDQKLKQLKEEIIQTSPEQPKQPDSPSQNPPKFSTPPPSSRQYSRASKPAISASTRPASDSNPPNSNRPATLHKHNGPKILTASVSTFDPKIWHEKYAPIIVQPHYESSENGITLRYNGRILQVDHAPAYQITYNNPHEIAYLMAILELYPPATPAKLIHSSKALAHHLRQNHPFFDPATCQANQTFEKMGFNPLPLLELIQIYQITTRQLSKAELNSFLRNLIRESLHSSFSSSFPELKYEPNIYHQIYLPSQNQSPQTDPQAVLSLFKEKSLRPAIETLPIYLEMMAQINH